MRNRFSQTTTHLTLDEYKALPTFDNDTLYVIVDSNNKPTGAVALGGTLLAQTTAGGPRPTLLVFGNSLAAQSTRFMTNANSQLTAAVLPGARQFTVSGANLANFKVGNYCTILTATSELFTTQITAVDPITNTVSIADPVPSKCVSGAAVQGHSNALTKRAASYARTGFWEIANAELGAPLEIVPSYGFTGQGQEAMLPDLAKYLQFYRPRFVALHLAENDINGNVETARILELSRAATRMVVQAGAVPIVCSSAPWTNFTSAGKIASFDAYLAFVNNIHKEFPGAIGVDLSTPWLDTGAAGRVPLANYTDGVHPVNAYMSTTAVACVAALRKIVTPRTTHKDICLHYYPTTGTGGTATNIQAGSVVPPGWTVAADNNVTLTSSKTPTDDYLRLVYAVPSDSNTSGTRGYARLVDKAIPDYLGGRLVKFFVKAKVDSLTSISMLQVSCQLKSGSTQTEYLSWGQEAARASDSALVGRTLTMETPAIYLPFNATSYTLELAIRPNTIAGAANCAADITIIEAGMIMAGFGNINDADPGRLESRQVVPQAAPGIAASRFYGPHRSTTYTEQAIAAGSIYAIPFYVPEKTTFTKIGCRVTTAAASSNVRLGLYRAERGIPTSLVVDGGALSAAATGPVEATISTTLEPGMYFLAASSSNSAVAINWASVPDLRSIMGSASDNTNETTPVMTQAFGALPATFTVSSYQDTSSMVPNVWLRS